MISQTCMMYRRREKMSASGQFSSQNDRTKDERTGDQVDWRNQTNISPWRQPVKFDKLSIEKKKRRVFEDIIGQLSSLAHVNIQVSGNRKGEKD